MGLAERKCWKCGKDRFKVDQGTRTTVCAGCSAEQVWNLSRNDLIELVEEQRREALARD